MLLADLSTFIVFYQADICFR